MHASSRPPFFAVPTFLLLILLSACGGQEADAPPAASGQQIELRKVTVTDPALGGVPSHTLLVPKDWTVEDSRIVWRPARLRIPEKLIIAVSPEKDGIGWIPALGGSFTQHHPQYIANERAWGRHVSPVEGQPPPENVGVAVANLIRQVPTVSGVRVRKTERLPQVEQAMREISGVAGGQAGRIFAPSQVWTVGLDYVEEGVPMRAETTVMYMPPGQGTRNPINGSVFSGWRILFLGLISAKTERFEQQKPFLVSLIGTLRENPRWRMTSQQVIAANQRQNLADTRAWGRMMQQAQQTYSGISDDQMASWRRRENMRSQGQRNAVNNIHNVTDFQTPDGDTVRLPSFYDHVYTRPGSDTYILSEREIDDASLQGYEPIRPVR